MNKWLAGIVVIAAIAAGVGLVVQRTSGDSVDYAPGEVKFQDVEKDVTAGARLLDVRTNEEFEKSHVKSAINHPLDSIEDGQYPTASKNSKIYLYCDNAIRSAAAAELLRDAGFASVVDLGGIDDVRSMGAQLSGAD